MLVSNHRIKNLNQKQINLKFLIMKTHVIFVALALSAVMSNAQEVIELKEAKVDFSPASQTITRLGNSFLVDIKEIYSGEFQKDPLAFMNNHFDIKDVIAELEPNTYHSYQVTFKSRKGELKVDFDGEGEKTGSSLRFKNKSVPPQLQHQLYRDHKGWETIKTIHIARESNGKLERDYYKITMKKDHKKKNLKIKASDLGLSTLVAVN